ncbi:hypothetical protein [Streptomyces beihaiensis]|uniref:Lipoprotein n=1 Tax=Streptomyces beihaiensis TaxID=2984495 RepID=A0ABT3TTA7_9ACTN|nr:hypothetical protein [Streptomyces beihaiensis]MCX3060277.1 hypothetical protein [Streptomyces beihaiensis]
MESKPVLATLLLAALPAGCMGWHKLFPDDSVKLQVRQLNDPCFAHYLIRDGATAEFKRGLRAGDERQYARWEKGGRIEHSGFVAALVTLRGNMDKPVRITDLTVTVTSRSAPLTGSPGPLTGPGCGKEEPPDALGINLDAMAVGREISVRRLLSSPNQKEAAAFAKNFGPPPHLPRTVTNDDYYALYLVGTTKTSDCTWRARISWWDGDRDWNTTVDNDGHDFRVTADPDQS